MSETASWQPSASIPNLLKRAAIMAEIRRFFGYILERNTGFFLYIGFGFALSDAHHSAAFVHLSHHPVHQENQKYKRYQQT